MRLRHWKSIGIFDWGNIASLTKTALLLSDLSQVWLRSLLDKRRLLNENVLFTCLVQEKTCIVLIYFNNTALLHMISLVAHILAVEWDILTFLDAFYLKLIVFDTPHVLTTCIANHDLFDFNFNCLVISQVFIRIKSVLMNNQGLGLLRSFLKRLDWVLGNYWACVGISCLWRSILVVSKRCFSIQLGSNLAWFVSCIIIVKHAVSVTVRISLLYIFGRLSWELTSDLVCKWRTVRHNMVWSLLALADWWFLSLIILRLCLSYLEESLGILWSSIC